MEVSLRVLGGKQKGREIPLPKTVFVIGRDPLCHLRPHCILVSRRHCGIAHSSGKLVVRDFKSANGTFLNQQRIESQATVHNGDILTVGDLSFAFQINPTSVEEAPASDMTHDAVQWLMEMPEDSAVLDPGASTAVIKFPTEENDEAKKGDESANGKGAAEKPQGSKGLSAGKYLKDYLDKKN